MASEDNGYKTVYTGSNVNVQHLQNLFNDSNIGSIVRNNFESGLRSGFGGGLPGQVQLLVQHKDFGKARKIVDETFGPVSGEDE